MNRRQTAMLAILAAAGAAGVALVRAADSDHSPARADIEREVRARGYAVADLERVASAIGANFQYRMTVEDFRARRQQRLDAESADLKKELDELGARFRVETDPERRAVLEQDIRRRQGRAAALLAQARTDLAAFDQKIKQAFRKDIQPAIDKVCQAHGAAMMLARGNELLYALPELDLTDALIAELKANPIDLPRIPLDDAPATRPD